MNDNDFAPEAAIGLAARAHMLELERILGVAWWAFRPKAATIHEATTPGGPVTGVTWPELGTGVFLLTLGLAVEVDLRPGGGELDVWLWSRLGDGPRVREGPERIRLDDLPPWLAGAFGRGG